jgi:hypothetical protein
MSEQNTEVRVVFYSGYKGRETPRAILVGAKEYPVEKILWRRRVQDKDSSERHELFRCRVAGKEVTLRIGPSGECRIVGPGLDHLLPPIK